MRRACFLIVTVIAALCGRAAAMEAVAAHAVFRTAKDSPYVELYWQISPQSLHYKKDSTGRLTARIRTQLRISGDTGVVYKDVYFLQTKPFRPAEGDAPPILEQERISIPDGRTTIELFLAEEGRSDSRYYYRDTFYTATSILPAYSTLQLLDTAFASGAKSPFLKAGYQLLPMPLPFYDEGRQRLLAYFEIYRTQGLPKTAFPMKQILYVSKRRGERDAGASTALDTIVAGAPVSAFRHTLSLAALPSGNYWLNASLRTAVGIEVTSAAVFFQMINKHPLIAAVDTAAAAAADTAAKDNNLLDLAKTFVAKYSMAELRAILKMLRPGADPSEEYTINAFLSQPNDLYTRYLIYNHFATINPKDPARAWKDFSDGVREVNRRFGAGGVMGYETDRGMIYLRYGKPDEEVRVLNEAGALPYEIWRYNSNQKMHGPGLFLFYSPASMGSGYQLLHSTVTGERQNPSWRSMLYSTGHSSGNLNARAEEYFSR